MTDDFGDDDDDDSDFGDAMDRDDDSDDDIDFEDVLKNQELAVEYTQHPEVARIPKNVDGGEDNLQI